MEIGNIHVKKLKYLLLIAIILNFINFLIYNSFFIFTFKFARDYNFSYDLLTALTYYPTKDFLRLTLMLISFFGLISLMIFKLKSKHKLNFYILAIMEFSLAFIAMDSINFASNMIVIVVFMDLMLNIDDDLNWLNLIVIFVFVYLLSSFTIISKLIKINSIYDLLSFYSAKLNSLYLFYHNLEISISFVIFISFIIYWVLNKLYRFKEVKELNRDLQEANQQLKDYANVKEKMGETRERNRLAREIHDTLGHTLTGIASSLEACNATFEINPNYTKEKLPMLASLARDGLKDVRRSVNRLRPDALEGNSIKDAINKMLNEYRAINHIQIDFLCNFDLNIDSEDIENTIYRFVQECTTNAIRHGLADKIVISIANEANNLLLICEDNGRGSSTIVTGFGLTHMQERVDLLKGVLTYYSTDSGFVVIMKIPLREGL